MLPRIRTKNVYIGPARAAPDDFVEVPKGNDRMFRIALHNRRRGNRVTIGTATLHRLFEIVQRIRGRHPRCVKNAAGRHPGPMVIRAFRGGPVVLTCEHLPGPVASVATRQ